MRTRLTLFLMLILFTTALWSSPAAAGPPPKYFVDESKLPFEPIPGLDAEQYWGVKNGAGYRIEVPTNWNGELVVWAHGFRGDGLELTVDNHPIRPWLLANGYAWAASSYSKNDYDIAQGAKDTHALTKQFNGIVSKPSRVYLTGASMGGHITGVAIEQWPKTYDGAMPICGVMGDYDLFDYFLDFNVVAQALSGQNLDFPVPDDYLVNAVPTIKSNLEIFPGTFPFTLNSQGEQLKGMTMMRSGGDRPVFDQGFLFWNGVAGDFLFGFGTGDGTLPRSPGVAVDNVDRVYQFDTDPALSAAEIALNDSVLRVEKDAQGRHKNGLANVPPVNGDIRIPVLSYHTLGDLFVPFSMQQVYAQRVAANNSSDLLVQRAVRDFGHCTFTGEELVAGFSDLTNWVENGVKPAGDDVLDPIAVADPNFGCAHTSSDRLYPAPISIPACP